MGSEGELIEHVFFPRSPQLLAFQTIKLCEQFVTTVVFPLESLNENFIITQKTCFRGNNVAGRSALNMQGVGNHRHLAREERRRERAKWEFMMRTLITSLRKPLAKDIERISSLAEELWNALNS